MQTMRFSTAQLSALLLLIALALPSLGPLVDHHYAEHQVGHRHLTVVRSSDHSHAYQNLHSHTPDAAAATQGQPIVLYNFDTGPAVPSVAIVDDVDMQSFLLFQPSSEFPLPFPSQAQVTGHYPIPP